MNWNHDLNIAVALLVSAWIEIRVTASSDVLRNRRTPCECVDWNNHDREELSRVASRTPCECVDWNNMPLQWIRIKISRTPCECVDWNYIGLLANDCNGCRTPCECVDWNKHDKQTISQVLKSHSLWVRGLKSKSVLTGEQAGTSHSLWVRGLK